jgi:hypothetical protein
VVSGDGDGVCEKKDDCDILDCPKSVKITLKSAIIFAGRLRPCKNLAVFGHFKN